MMIYIASSCGNNHNTNSDMDTEWQKMNELKQESLEWFEEAKYGMFIHWGLYSVPAGMWNGKTMEEMGRPQISEWIQYVAEIPRDEYASLAEEFNPVNFDANAIARLARDAGMKYLVITSKHHDGFAMYHSKACTFNIVDATPFERDVLKELYDACKIHGIEFGIYYSHNIDWAHGGDCQYSVIKEYNDKHGFRTTPFGANLWDPSPNTFEEYLEQKAYPQVRELMTMFPDMKILWYDMSRFMMPEQSFEFYHLASSQQPQILVNSRVGNGFGDYVITGDNVIPADPDNITERREWENYSCLDKSGRYIRKPWETVGTLNNSWGYKSYDDDWKSPGELLFWLVEIVSKGGNYMLNIGPRACGEVPEESSANLRAIGDWLAINGEAIYNTKRWHINREGPTTVEMHGTSARQEQGFTTEFTPEDFWFTVNKKRLYAIAMEVPENRQVVIRSLNDPGSHDIGEVSILGSIEKPDWELTAEGLRVQLPEVLPSDLGYVIRIRKK